MIQETVEVLWNKRLADRYFRIGLSCNDAYLNAAPGQFVMVRLPYEGTPLLRRPFSIHRQIFDENGIWGIELLCRIVGDVTQKLAALSAGDTLDLLGPLGRGFKIPIGCRRVYLAAGGIGVAPLMFLAEVLKTSVPSIEVTVFLGGRTKEDILCADMFSQLGMQVVISTDDGSAGKACLVTQPLEEEIKTEMPDIIFACGPEPMLKCIQDMARIYAVSCQISVETLMACGIGVCLGCAIETREKVGTYRHVCMDGPVFDASILE